MSISFAISGVDQSISISNANFERVCAALGIPFTCAGSIDPNDLEKRLDYLTAQLDCNTVGFSTKQILDYFCKFATLVFLARLADEQITWG